MKFGLLPRLARASGVVFEAFATGHYARLRRDEAGSHLLMAAERRRDQSYFLYRLTQEQLGEALLPLGERTKDEVRKIASDLSLSVKDKRDSQEFYSGDYTELVGLAPREGEIRDRRGRVLGHHRGYWHFTVGQRRGLGVAPGQSAVIYRGEELLGGGIIQRSA